MFIVLLNAILSSIVLIVIVCAALLLTAVAIALIIVSCVRSAKAKKRNHKTHKVGLWVGIAMLIVPWIVVISAVVFVVVTDKVSNRWKFDRAVVAQAVADKDAGDLYDLMAPYVMEENDLTEDDLEVFLDKCDIDNNSSKDMERYTSYKFLGEASDPTGNHYRPDGDKFTYTMYYVNDEGAEVVVSGILYNAKDKDKVGIYYIEYRVKDPQKKGKWLTVEMFGEKP